MRSYRKRKMTSREKIALITFLTSLVTGLCAVFLLTRSVRPSAGKPYEMLEVTCPLLPEDKPRYLMGVGTPANILEGIARGIDMFDCVMPTRNGRNGMLFTWDGIMNMRNAKWTDDFSPLDPLGTSFVDSYYTRAYIHHLFIAKEMFAAMVASEHNLAFYLDLVRVAREHIVAGDFLSWKNAVAVRLMQRL